MKKFFYVAVMALALTACGNKAEKEVTNATDIVPESQRALDELKKGWLEVEKKQENSEDTLAYPFGGWTDADKYQK